MKHMLLLKTLSRAIAHDSGFATGFLFMKSQKMCYIAYKCMIVGYAQLHKKIKISRCLKTNFVNRKQLVGLDYNQCSSSYIGIFSCMAQLTDNS